MARWIKPIIEEQRVDYQVNSLLYAQQANRQTKIRLSHEGTLAWRDFQPASKSPIEP
jgi:hypothetical protein